jgi:hypothetical protein
MVNSRPGAVENSRCSRHIANRVGASTLGEETAVSSASASALEHRSALDTLAADLHAVVQATCGQNVQEDSNPGSNPEKPGSTGSC